MGNSEPDNVHETPCVLGGCMSSTIDMLQAEDCKKTFEKVQLIAKPMALEVTPSEFMYVQPSDSYPLQRASALEVAPLISKEAHTTPGGLPASESLPSGLPRSPLLQGCPASQAPFPTKGCAVRHVLEKPTLAPSMLLVPPNPSLPLSFERAAGT